MEEETRKEAIVRFLKGESPKSICRDLSRSKHWFFKLLRRFQTGGLDWYKDRSRAPLSRPSQISEERRALIVSSRKRLEAEPFAQTGVSAIKWELRKLGADFPSDSTINRILRKEGLVKKNLVYAYRGRVSVFQRGPGPQQDPPGRFDGPPIHQRRW